MAFKFMNTLKFTLAVGLVFTAVILVTTPPLAAQSIVTGDLTGVVTDSSGAAVAGADLTLKNDASGETRLSKTNGLGQYRFSLLKPDTYTLTVKASGMANADVRVNVELGQITNVPVQVSVASVSTTVEVVALTPLIDTENANMATTYSGSQLAALPVPGGDVTSYAYTAPGVVLNTGSGYGNFSAFGLPSTSNLFTTNGNDNMDPYLNLNNSGASNLSMGSNELQQIAVVSNGYTAQYGRQAGAQLNASTKSGLNEFHGNALYWWNGSNMNANDWFGNNTNPVTPRPHAVNNQWAASVGGPILKNKLFFFADYEGLRFVLPGTSGLQGLPSPQFASYVESVVPAAELPFYQKMFNLYAGSPGAARANAANVAASDPSLGCADFAGTAGFGPGGKPCSIAFVSNQNNLNTEWLLTARIDYNISNSDRLFGRFKTDHGIQATGTDPVNSIFNANSIQPEYEGQINETHIFNGTTVNNFILSGMWYKALFTAENLPGALATFPTTFDFTAVNGWANLGGTDNNYPQGRIVSQWQVTDDFSKTHGAHELKFGINFRRNLVSDYATGVNTSGLVSVTSLSEFAQGFVNPCPACSSFYDQAYPNFGAVRIKLYSLGLYAQDQWKASSKLSFTGALRVDRNSNPSCVQDCFARMTGPFTSISHDVNQPYNAVINTGLSNAFPSIQSVVFAPRVGVAYSLHPRTVIRGGVGLFTDLFPAFLIDRFITNAPNVSTFSGGVLSGDQAFAPGVNLGGTPDIFTQANQANAAFQAGFTNGANLAALQTATGGQFSPPAFYTMGSKQLNPAYLEWNVELQQELSDNYSLSLNYVGNHGYNVMTINPFTNANCAACAPGQTFAGIGTTPPDQRFSQVVNLTNNGYSNYSGLTGSFKYRLSKSFQGQVNYTWSHGLDTCSNNCLLPFIATSTLTSIRYQVSPSLPGTSYGNSDYDVRQNFNANYVYTSKDNWSSKGMNYALGGWTIAGTFYFHTGYPWSPVSTDVRNNLANVTPLRNGTPLAEFAVPPQQFATCTNPNTPCATPSEFVNGSTQFNFGNYPRNTLRGPAFFDTDLNVTKNFKVTERVGLAIGASFFNVLNHPNFDLPNNVVNAGNFGSITNSVSPATSPYGAFLSVPLTGRIVQLNGRVTF